MPPVVLLHTPIHHYFRGESSFEFLPMRNLLNFGDQASRLLVSILSDTNSHIGFLVFIVVISDVVGTKSWHKRYCTSLVLFQLSRCVDIKILIIYGCIWAVQITKRQFFQLNDVWLFTQQLVSNLVDTVVK